MIDPKMTNQHPLTEEMMDKIHGDEPGYSNPYDEDDMRAVADWQLEQVLKWLNETISERGSCLEAVNIPEELAKAMRPTKISEKVQRWIEGASEEELLKLFNQLENNS